MRRIRWEISSTQEIGHGSKQMIIWKRKIRVYAGFGGSSISRISWIFIIVAHAVLGLAFSCYKRALFRLIKLDISVSKFHDLVPVVQNKDPPRLHALLEQTPSESHLQNPPDTHYFSIRNWHFSSAVWHWGHGSRLGCETNYEFWN